MRGADYVFPVRIYNVPTGLTIFYSAMVMSLGVRSCRAGSPEF